MQSTTIIARTKNQLDDAIHAHGLHLITEPRSIMVDGISVWVAYVTECLGDGLVNGTEAICVAEGADFTTMPIWPTWKAIRGCETCVGKCLATELMVGMHVGGRRIEKLVQRQALGIVMVDWDFGRAEIMDEVHGVTA